MGGGGRRREGGEEMGRKSTGDSGNSGSVFVGGRWDPPVESEKRAKPGIKVEHWVEERDLCFTGFVRRNRIRPKYNGLERYGTMTLFS